MEERDIVIDLKSGDLSRQPQLSKEFVDSEFCLENQIPNPSRENHHLSQDRMDSHGSEFGSEYSNEKRMSSVGSVYLKSIVGPDVKNKLS